MSTIPKIKSIMTPSPIAANKGNSVAAAQSVMQSNKIRHLPVVEADRPIGILSDRDISLALAANQGLETAETLTVGDICTTDIFSVSSDDSLDDIAFTMAEKQIGSALVVEDERLVGIFTATDACEFLGHCLRSKAG
ncbi:MAG: CBS domain-containing protein [Pseudomonadota bacterium]